MKINDILKRIIAYIQEQKYKKGDKLPSERDLAILLGVSRTTIREAIRRLEERGIIIVKRGSGIYINKSAETLVIDYRLETSDQATLIKDHLEARLMIIPVVVNCAAARAAEKEILDLQNCIVNMSRAIVAKELKLLAEADSEFCRVLAIMTKNHKLVRLVDQLNIGSEVFWEYFIKSDEFVNNVIFAGYVEIVNAIKRKDPVEAMESAKRNVIDACEWLSKIIDTPCTQIFGYKTKQNYINQ